MSRCGESSTLLQFSATPAFSASFVVALKELCTGLVIANVAWTKIQSLFALIEIQHWRTDSNEECFHLSLMQFCLNDVEREVFDFQSALFCARF